MMSASDVAEHIKEKHLEMIMNAKQAGRQIPAVPVSADIVGQEVARTSVEASQRSMHRANKKSFVVPRMPWHKGR